MRTQLDVAWSSWLKDDRWLMRSLSQTHTRDDRYSWGLQAMACTNTRDREVNGVKTCGWVMMVRICGVLFVVQLIAHLNFTGLIQEDGNVFNRVVAFEESANSPPQCDSSRNLKRRGHKVFVAKTFLDTCDTNLCRKFWNVPWSLILIILSQN